MTHAARSGASPERRLVAAELVRTRSTAVVGREVRVLDRVTSTNDLVWQMAEDGAPEGLTVFAHAQTAGRGRFRRRWISPAGKGIWCSILLRPEVPTARIPLLTIAGALGAADAIREVAGVFAGLRWPNDVVLGDRKVAGVLVEGRSGLDAPPVFVLGVGINVSFHQDEMPEEIGHLATSVEDEAGRAVDGQALAATLLARIDSYYREILADELVTIGAAWRALSSTLNRRVAVREDGKTYTGTVIDIDPVEGLLVRLDRGFVRTFRGEHVTERLDLLGETEP